MQGVDQFRCRTFPLIDELEESDCVILGISVFGVSPL